MELQSFQNWKHALAHKVTLSHRDETQRLCFYTDAPDLVWSGIVTQVPLEYLCQPHAAQRHSLLAFCSGKFNKTQFGWSILEKEAFAVLATLDRMHWLAASPAGFDLFTDHNNLIFLFDPLSIVPDLSQTSMRKVLRWAVKLNIYSYTCFHIKGTDNVWADLFGRWSAPGTVRRLISIPVLPSTATPDFEWPSVEELSSCQRLHESTRPTNTRLENGLWRNPVGSIWVPDDAGSLQLRLCVISHTGPSGHRGQAATENALHKTFFWSTHHFRY